jgi:hypothetical protein
MSMDELRTAITSLEGYPGQVGLMGGEPCVHPQFREICEIFQEMIPDKCKREFWTAGYKWEEYKDIIYETFEADLIHYNDHSRPGEGWHQPILISIDEMVDDKDKMWRLIDNCWVQERWSASITPKGAFFCEVAGALDMLFDGPGGWPLEKGWWKRTPSDFEVQKKNNCVRCSAALPMARPSNHTPYDLVSIGNAKDLEASRSPKYLKGDIQIMEKEEVMRYFNSKEELIEGPRGEWLSHSEWRPFEFRTTVWHEPGEGEFERKEVRSVQTGRSDKVDYDFEILNNQKLG